ncbi:MAG: hypothetical protein ACM308_06365, partial [Qipengyuania vulgaris]
MLALAVMSAGLIVTLALFGTPIRASEIAEHLLGTFRFGLPKAGFDSAPGADIFATVGELVPVGVSAFADALGPLGLALGLVGLPL